MTHETESTFECKDFMNQLLNISLKKISLEDTLERIIEQITSISWLSLIPRGGIWLVEDETDVLILKGEKNLPESLRSACSRIPFGNCFCGKSALSGEIIYVGSEEIHEKKCHDRIPNNHYCIPMMYAEKVMGMICLFLKEGQARDMKEEEFLRAMANLIAEIIKRKQFEDALLHLNEFSKSIINSINDSISIINLQDFKITGVNSVFLRELDLKEEDVIGKTCFELIPIRSHICHAPDDICPLLETKITGKYSHAEHHFEKNGIHKFTDISTSPIRDEKGSITQVVHVSRDITQRKIAEERLLQANIELKRADELKNQFLSISSHELRTPLTPIKAQIQMILTGYLGEISEKQRRSLDMILMNTLRLDHLIGDILDISKLEAGAMTFFMRKANLSQIIENAVNTMLPHAMEKNIIMEFRNTEIPEIVLDVDRITQIIMNLINNAIKFTDSGGSIEVELSDHADYATVKVKDSGIGIGKEAQQRLFTPFFQVDSTYSRKYEGSGLGLAISRRIITYHNGEMWVESEEGKGSTFFFTIPYNNEIKEVIIQSDILG